MQEGNNSVSNERREYNTSFNMKTQKDKVLQQLQEIGVFTRDASDYNKVQWILDNMYLPKQPGAQEVKQRLFEASGILDPEGYPDYTMEDVRITDDDIEAVQQLAIWYYTNPENKTYHSNDNTEQADIELLFNNWSGSDGGYRPFSDLYGEEGRYRQVECTLLYRYLLTMAKNYVEYIPADVTAPLTFYKSRVTIVKEGTNYIAGPYKINQNSNIAYTLKKLGFTDQNGNALSGYKLLNANKVEVGGNIQSLYGQDFYISLPKTTNVKTIRFEIQLTYNKTNATYYTTSETTRRSNQPVVLVERENFNYQDEVSVNIPELGIFDLSLRKFITSINGVAPSVSREPKVDLTNLKLGKATTATYTHPKNALTVEPGDIVTYTIRVYNEGTRDGYATQVTDHLPQGLKLAENSAINRQYNWSNPSGDGRTIVTNQLQNHLLKAFDGSNLSYADLQIQCVVTATTQEVNQTLKNIAEITQDADEDKQAVNDRDSVPGNVVLNNYTGSQQDDDDYEHLILPAKHFDLSLRKFITAINGVAPQVSREPRVDLTNLRTGKVTTATYTHPKNALTVEKGDIVTYTIRVYNEGTRAGYATQVTDHLPTGLKLAENSAINQQYGWTNPTGDGKTIVTTKLKDTLLNAFNGTNLDYQDLQIQCEVIAKAKETEQTLKNIAEITQDADENKQTVNDRDSVPGNVVLNNYTGSQQDDDDYEHLVLPAKHFDLALRKFITSINGVAPSVSREPQVDMNALKAGTSTTATYNHPKNALAVETGDTVVYTLRIYNEGTRDGYATQITDHLPEGLELATNSRINQQNGWKNPTGDGKTIVTDKLKDTLLRAFNGTTLDHQDLQVECVVIAENEDVDQKLKNIAEITQDADEEKEPITDRDSEPGNVVLNNYTGSQQDDDDYEELVLPRKNFDLSLRKFVTQINGKNLQTSREPQVDINALKAGTATTAIYNHIKTPVSVQEGSIVTYTIRVYNEGERSGYVKEITDHLPPELEFLPEDEQNIANGWYYDENDVNLRTIKTNRLSKENDVDNLIKAFDGTTLDYKEVSVKCKVKTGLVSGQKITNIADITAFTDSKGKVVRDIDSQENNVVLPQDPELPNYKDSEIESGIAYIPGQQDDDDFEKLKVQIFDLALRKFITQVDTKNITDRIPQLSMNEEGKIVYQHTKEPLEVQTGATVIYTIRVYNEGDIAGYASKVVDNIPEGLQFLPDNTLNQNYRWIMIDEDGNETEDLDKAKRIVTDYLSKEQETSPKVNLIKGFDKTIGITDSNPDYRDVRVAFKVIEPNTSDRILTNIAEIAEDADENGDPIDDIDSTPDNNKEEEDDIDKEHVKLVYFDLALRKFITKVNTLDINNRIPTLSMNEEGKIEYTHTKTPVEVEQNDVVTYTLRIYNEGTLAGYAKEVMDNIPEGLIYLPDHETNKEYRWKMIDKEGNETTEVEKAQKITTDYLSKAQEKQEGDNLIKAFDKEKGITDSNPDYRDVKVAFKVTEPNTSDRIIINTAEISDDADKDNGPVEDIDSTPGNNKEEEDDIDIEKIKVKYFDLALKKWVTKVIVIEDGKETVTDTGHTGDENPEPVVKVDLKDKKINKVTVKFGYKIKVTNEGQIAGYAKAVKDYIPNGLKFVAEDNPLWTQLNEKEVETTQLENTLLQPGESATVEILLTWINGEDNLGLQVNVAEISKDYNDSHTPDIDSTPDNKKEGEDDIDDAPVILGIKTGEARLYIGITTVVFITLAGGIYLIKKYVLD